MTLSDLIFLGAFLAVVVGVALLVGAFLGLMAAIGAALVVLSGVMVVGARAVANDGGET
jgi:hypothetical protein